MKYKPGPGRIYCSLDRSRPEPEPQPQLKPKAHDMDQYVPLKNLLMQSATQPRGTAQPEEANPTAAVYCLRRSQQPRKRSAVVVEGMPVYGRRIDKRGV
jgi:hypothetical protein